MNGIVLIGRPGSGKSTIGKELAEKLDLLYVSSGDIARGMGPEVNEMLERGEMAPEQAMRMTIRSIIYAADSGVVLDGFPRTLDQYHFLLSIDHNLTYIHIDAMPTDCYNRVMTRCRPDDNEESIRNRIRFYKENTEEILNRLRICINVKNNEKTDPMILADYIARIWR